MPQYRIIYREPHTGPDRDWHLPRIEYVEAASLVKALEALRPEIPVDQISEIAVTRTPVITNQTQIRREIDLYLEEQDLTSDDFEGYLDYEFSLWVDRVVNALRDSQIVPDLHLALLSDGDTVDYAQVQIFDNDSGTYRARGVEIKGLTNNRDAVGMEGLVSIADALIYEADALR